MEEAQGALCPGYRTVLPDPAQSKVYEQLFAIYKGLYLSLGRPHPPAVTLGDVLPRLRQLAESARLGPQFVSANSTFPAGVMVFG